MKRKIKSNKWQFEQDLFSIRDLSSAYIEDCLTKRKGAVSPDKPKGKLIWLYLNRDMEAESVENACQLSRKLSGTPVTLMLLNDADGRLDSALCDYLALRNMSDADCEKFGRHYADRVQQTDKNIRKRNSICAYSPGLTH